MADSVTSKGGNDVVSLYSSLYIEDVACCLSSLFLVCRIDDLMFDVNSDRFLGIMTLRICCMWAWMPGVVLWKAAGAKDGRARGASCHGRVRKVAAIGTEALDGQRACEVR